MSLDTRRHVRPFDRRWWLGAIVVLILAACSLQPAAVGSSSPGATGEPRFAGTTMDACVITGSVPVEASVDGFCGRLQVPEDRANPEGRQIGLRVAVVPAADQPSKPDPLFVIAGGPGDASSSFFAWLPDRYAEVHARHDIVLVDQRGTGDSTPLSFPPAPDTSGLADRLADEAIATWVEKGLATLPADPRFFTSTVAADDLDDVRAALGYEQIDLYGTSYGGTLVQYYLRQHGEHVRVAILDGATPLDVPVMERLAANSQAALDLLLSRCERDQACHEAYPEIASEWSALLPRLASGIATSVVDPETGAPAVADLLQVGPSLHHALLTGATAAQVPAGIHLAFEGRWEETGDAVPSVSNGLSSQVMAHEILCSEAWARFDPAEVRRTGAGSYAMPMFVAQAATQRSVCRHLPPGVVPADDGAALRTDVPILWLTADGDPQDPPAHLAGVADTQPNSTVVVMPAQEHVVGHLGCGPTVIAAFIDAGTADGLETSCIGRGPPPAPTFRVP
jgi:pimeloyl-ACP methyl ester carboxylesterase